MIISVSKSFVASLISSPFKSIAKLRIYYWIKWRQNRAVCHWQSWSQECYSTENVLRQVVWILDLETCGGQEVSRWFTWCMTEIFDGTHSECCCRTALPCRWLDLGIGVCHSSESYTVHYHWSTGARVSALHSCKGVSALECRTRGR